jgi:hypothetical protein
MSAVIKLPETLQPWRAWLDWFDPEIAAQVGEWLLRLNPLLGCSQARAQGGEAEPDGIDDLRRRGPYERLVLSEWAVADAMPDEFLRRAAHHEHLFLAPKLKSRQADALTVAVFDAGAAQLGAPRLLHVALWILLARRAQAAQARFAWGLAHEPGQLREADAPEQLRHLLGARHFGLPQAEALSGWREHFIATGAPAGERWWVGGAEPLVSGSFSHVATIKRGFDDQLHVRLGTPQARKLVALPLPPSRVAVRVLQGDFISTRRTRTSVQRIGERISLRQPPLFNAKGSHVAVPLLAGGKAMLVKVRDFPGRDPKLVFCKWPYGHEMVSGVVTDNSFAGVVTSDKFMQFWNLGIPPVARPPADQFGAAPGQSRWLSGVWLRRLNGSNLARVLVLDLSGRLLSWASERSGGRQRPKFVGATPELIQTDVLCLIQADPHNAVYVYYHEGQLRGQVLHRDGSTHQVFRVLMADKPSKVWLRGFVKDHWHGSVCVEWSPKQRSQYGGTHRMYSFPSGQPPHQDLHCTEGSKAIGLVQHPEWGKLSQLLTLRADRRALVAVSPSGYELVHESNNDIMSASVSPDGRRVAYVDLKGHLVVLGGESGRSELLRLDSQQDLPEGKA